jgi:Putative prokaryotic signal transducing protein
MINKDKEVFITAFSGTLWEAEMVKSLLYNAGVESFFQHSTGSSYAYDPIFSQAVKVIINESDAPIAKEIVEEYTLNLEPNKSIDIPRRRSL